jgi:predicted AlkP superfamily pyrophosphatase or phosphodiesterase
MKWWLTVLLVLCFEFNGHAQAIQRPKLVVGIVVDQMRWDYLNRFHDRFAPNGGFKRLLSMGFNCKNTSINYTPTFTACGHASIYTGSVPAVHGITGNDWWDNRTQAYLYCTEDTSASTVGNNGGAGKMSPRNMLTTTIGDELRLTTNKISKVIGIALKDRGGILPAGHSANAAYWYDSKAGEWITSSYYMNALPAWVTNFNARKLVDSFYKQSWNTLYPISTYTRSTADEKSYEVKPFGAAAKGFPYDLKAFAGTNYNPILATPFGNTLTTEFAKDVIEYEQMGVDSITDLLAISYSSTDYIGHSFGTNAIEIEDTYLRLDKELGDFFDFLDNKIGKNQWLLFLSADHGAAQAPAFMKENKIPAGHFTKRVLFEKLNEELKKKFDKKDLVIDIINYQVVLNLPLIESDKKLKMPEIKSQVVQYLTKQEGIERAFALDDLAGTTLNTKIKGMVANGYYPARCGQIQLMLKPQWIDEFLSGGTTHGVWNPYDARIPLLWYGWNIKNGTLDRETDITDIAPTLAALLGIQPPNGSVGKVINEVIK